MCDNIILASKLTLTGRDQYSMLMNTYSFFFSSVEVSLFPGYKMLLLIPFELLIRTKPAVRSVTGHFALIV